MASEDKSFGSNDWLRIAEAFAAKDSTRAEEVVTLVAGLLQVMSGQATPVAPQQKNMAVPEEASAGIEPAAAAPSPTPSPVSSSAATARAEQIHAEATETAPARAKKTTSRSTTATAKPSAEMPAPATKPAAAPEEVNETSFEHITKAAGNTAPAVSIDQAVSDELVVCLECGRSMKMLKRHLGSTHDMTPEEYKYRWDLPEDFPITAPNYSASKSVYAKDMGFGITGSKAAPKKRGRKKATSS